MIVNRIKNNNYLNNPLIRDSFKLATSHFIMLLLPLIVTPILSRIYSPEYFGEWGVFSSTYYIISVVLFLCYEYAIIKVTKEDFPNTVILCFGVSFIIIVISIFVFYVGDTQGIKFFLNFKYKLPLVFFLFVSSFSKIFNYISNRYEKYWVMSAEYFLSGLSQALLRILFGMFVIFDNGLIAGTILSQVICCLFYIFFLYNIFNSNFFSRLSFFGIVSVAKNNKKFPLFDAPSTLLSYAAMNLPVIILSFYFEMAEIGCFSVILQLLLLPMSLIGSAIGRVYYRNISLDDSTEKAISTASLQVLSMTLYLALIPAFVLACGGDYLITMFLGPKWTTAGGVALCMALWSIPTILTQPLLPIFRKENKQDKMFLYDGMYFIFGLGALLLSCLLGGGLYLCIFIYSIGCFVAKAILFIEICKITDISFHKNIKKPIIFCYIACFAILLTRIAFLL